MRKLIQTFFCAGVVLMTLQSAWGFSLAGPMVNGVGTADDNWQTLSLGYGHYDPVVPKDYTEGYRPVVPVMYYACDESFAGYYGVAGVTNVDAAFAILNGVMCGMTNTPVFWYDTVTNGVTLDASGVSGGVPVILTATNSLDRYSADLSEFPVESQQWNYSAKALMLADLKSAVLHDVVLELGLADAPRYVWVLHNREGNPNVIAPQCPQDEVYLVNQRNFDPTQVNPYSSYINGSLYLFDIFEDCGDHTAVPYDAITKPAPADKSYDYYPPITTGGLDEITLEEGSYFTGVTRDDAAGLKYLLSSNTIKWEATAPSGSLLFAITTNYAAEQPFPPTGTVLTNATGFYYYNGDTNGGYGYGDLGAFLAFARTNSSTNLQAAYPGVVISSVNVAWAWATNETYSSYYTNPPLGSPIYVAPRFVVVTNPVGYWRPFYSYTFANVITNHYYPKASATLLSYAYSAPYGSPYWLGGVTNTAVTLTNQVGGDFFVVPLNYGNTCPIDVVDGSHFNVVAVTNLLTGLSTNYPTATNITGTNSLTSISNSVYLVTYFTNYSYLIMPVNCGTETNTAALRRGVGRIQFIRHDYDSILGQYWQPVTNTYNMVMISNSQSVVEHYVRVVTTPDFVFQASDLTIPTADHPYGLGGTVSTPLFDSSAIKTALAGPGTILPGSVIVFNKNQSDLYLNGSMNYYNDLKILGSVVTTNAGAFLNYSTQYKMWSWGSFDGSTNLPVAYPSTVSIADLMNQLVFQVTPASVSDGTNGRPYSVAFTVTGGQSPYVWTAPGLSVPGLAFNRSTATLSGTPSQAGVFNFTLQVTDAVNRAVNFNYSITIH